MNKKITVLKGDGIGPEIVDEALKVLVDVLKSQEISKYINDTYDGAVVPLN